MQAPLDRLSPADLDAACQVATARWRDPFPGFASGHDPRTSDSGLLVLFYGGLHHAAGHGWLNAGRRLIDRTYVDMLWQVQSLTALRSCTPERVAASLDSFIRDEIAPWWERLPVLDDEDRRDLARHLVEQAAATLFGSLRSEVAASRLLFFLCPMLPLFNLSRGHLLALQALGADVAETGYPAFHAAAETVFERFSEQLAQTAAPPAPYGSSEERSLIDGLNRRGDWWRRRVFDALLQRVAVARAPADPGLFGCGDDGRPG